jgi:hypothetical protein
MAAGTKGDLRIWLNRISATCSVMWGITYCAVLFFRPQLIGPMLFIGLPAAFVLAAIASITSIPSIPGPKAVLKGALLVVCGMLLALAVPFVLYFVLWALAVIVATVVYWFLH